MEDNTLYFDPRICVIGAGREALAIVKLFSTKYSTMWFDINQISVNEQERIEEIRSCNFYIVALPTRAGQNRKPLLQPLIRASKIVGKVISRGDIVVYESTAFPGAIEEECMPEVEKVSGLNYNNDFFAGYCSVRIYQGERIHSKKKILIVTAGSTPEIGKIIDDIYASVFDTFTHLAPNIRMAEAHTHVSLYSHLKKAFPIFAALKL